MASAGQDQWIAHQFPAGYKGWGFDIGAADGIMLSNTLGLEVLGWEILCVEAMHACSPMLRAARKNFMICAVDAHAHEWGEFHFNLENPSAFSSIRPDAARVQATREVRVPVLTLNQILCISGFPRLDLVSIDIEGTELDALMGLDIARWHPRVIVAECWPDSDAAEKMQDYLGPFGYRDMITMDQDHGFLYVGDHWRADRQAVHHGIEAVARPGAGLPLPADEPGGVRPRVRRRDKKDLGSARAT